MKYDKKKLEKVLAFYTSNSITREGVTYSAKNKSNGMYSLKKSILGLCGECLPNPELSFQINGDGIEFKHYADFVTTPLKNIAYSQEEILLFSNSFEQLVEEFFTIMTDNSI